MSDEQATFNTIVKEIVAEHKSSRRWRNFFRLIFWGYITFLTIHIFNSSKAIVTDTVSSKPHVSVVSFEGVFVEADKYNYSTLVSSGEIIDRLRKAFSAPETKAVVFDIDSPGGSVYTAAVITDEIERLRKLYPEIKVYAVIKQIGASAAYQVAACADEIYAGRESLVGSIGVVAFGFNATEMLAKIGIKPQVFHKGKYKVMGNPFSDMTTDEKAKIDDSLQRVYDGFVKLVQQKRGYKLADNPDLFTGLVWSGEQALELGLIDGLGSLSYVLSEVIGVDEVIYYDKYNPAAFYKKVMDEFAYSMQNRLAYAHFGL